MANALYDDYKESCLGGGAHSFTDIPVDTIKVALVDLTVDYTFSAAHQDKADVTSYTGSTDQTLGAKTVTAGVFDNTADITFTSLSQSASKTVGAIVHFKDSGSAATSPLSSYHDNFTAVVPNGGDIVIQYNASGIYAL